MIEYNHISNEETNGASIVHLNVNQVPFLLKSKEDDI